MRAHVIALLLLSMATTASSQTNAKAPEDRGSALRDIVGTWQSDTVSGTSARSTCAVSPDGGSVICDQLITSATGVRHAMSFFMPDTASAFVFYGLGQPGDTMRPVRLVVSNHVWTYGGGVRSDDGRFYRTVNVFGAADAYTWRQESSTDGVTWVAGMHGRSRRVR